MSTLSQFAPFAGGGLKSFQTGYVVANTASSGSGEDTRFTNVTISSVSTTKAIPAAYGSGVRNIYNGIATYTIGGVNAILLPRLTSGTNLRISCNYDVGAAFGENTSISARWQVAEAN
jgi:hypothetical protein